MLSSWFLEHSLVIVLAQKVVGCHVVISAQYLFISHVKFIS